MCLVESAHCWEIEGGVASLDGAVGGVVVGRAWSGCCGIYNKTQSDIWHGGDQGLWPLPGRLCCLYLVEMVKEG